MLALFQCPRGHFLFSGRLTARFQGVRLSVSMPSRAFFVFWRGRAARHHHPHPGFQCPRGHFLFSGHERPPRPARGGRFGFNALAGIFCFLAFSTEYRIMIVVFRFQCPRGHFFVFWLAASMTRTLSWPRLFQCPRGHFLFSG